MVDENEHSKKDKVLTDDFEISPMEQQTLTPQETQTFATHTETVETFESISELGMVDHTVTTQKTQESEPLLPASSATTKEEPVAPAKELETALLEPAPEHIFEAAIDHSLAAPFLDDIKTYSEDTQGPMPEINLRYPFHLYITGKFGPFERDKLLYFITETPIGLSSSDLDLQIKSGRVLFPRISEFAGIKLIQELRDSGLQFSLKPSARDEYEPVRHDPPLSFDYDAGANAEANPSNVDISIFPAASPLVKDYREMGPIQITQYLTSKMVEAEASELFQDVIDRMMEALKHKARLKGANALTNYEQKISTLRLPSQYQILVSATMLAKK